MKGWVRYRIVWMLALSLLSATCIADAQTPVPMPTGSFSQPPSVDKPSYVPTLTFDVASIRELQPEADKPSWAIGLVSPPHACQFQAKAHTVNVLLALAYGFTPFDISNGPDWLGTTLYNVEGKCDPSVDQQLAKLTDDQAKLEKEHMLQAALADRFHLKAHWETKPANIYALELAKSGSRLQPAKVEPPTPPSPTRPSLKLQAPTSETLQTRTDT
jgi:uncharacterized protein (TIGR03435 family)